MASLRKRINLNCKDCIYDCKAPGTWRQQVTLCSVYSCELWDVRPTTPKRIPESILNYFGINSLESLGSEWSEKADLQSDGSNATITLPTESSLQESTKMDDLEAPESDVRGIDRGVEI